MFTEMTGDLGKEIQEQQNIKRKGPARFGVLDHWLFSIREGSVSYKLLPLQNLNTDIPPCPLSLQSSLPGGKSLSLGGQENVRSKHRVG